MIKLIDNIDLKIDNEDEQLILLLKRQPDKDFSTLYLYDFQQIFWLRKIDISYLQNLKEQLHIGTNMQTFIKCLATGIKQSSSLSFSKQQAKLLVKLSIGQGLTMNCTINLTTKLTSVNDQKGFKLIHKLFLRQLYQTKSSKQTNLQDQIDILRKRKQDEKVQKGSKDEKYVREVLGINQDKKDQQKAIIKRDLLNPNKAKRKHAGIKFSTLS